MEQTQPAFPMPRIAIAALQGDVSRCNELEQGNTCVNVIDVHPGSDGSGFVARLVAANVREHLSVQKTLPSK